MSCQDLAEEALATLYDVGLYLAGGTDGDQVVAAKVEHKYRLLRAAFRKLGEEATA